MKKYTILSVVAVALTIALTSAYTPMAADLSTAVNQSAISAVVAGGDCQPCDPSNCPPECRGIGSASGATCRLAASASACSARPGCNSSCSSDGKSLARIIRVRDARTGRIAYYAVPINAAASSHPAGNGARAVVASNTNQ